MKVWFFLFIIITTFFQSFLYGQNMNISGFDTNFSTKYQDNRAPEVIGITVPAVMIMYGLISLGDNSIRKIDFQIRHSLEQNGLFWDTGVDDYMQYFPAIAAYTLKLCGVENTHRFLDMTIIYGLSNLLAGGIVYQTKIITGRERPNHSDYLSFPSGHTETAFVAAEYLHQEYRNKSVWITIGGYGAATFVGVARVCKNKHWVSDVVTGAGIGILSTKVVYCVYPYLQKPFREREKPLHAFIFPGYSNGNLTINFFHTF